MFKYIAMAEEVGALAIGMDVDAAGIIPMTLAGQPVRPKSEAELKEIISRTSVPFIVKGIMTADEAEIAAEAGAAAIVVSNHAVLVGRPLLVAAAGAGEEGISLALETMFKELEQAMILTGCAKREDINLDVIA